jgi:VanZ family protein
MMGIIDENYQRLTPGRSPDIWDWVLDTIGVLLAIGLILFLNRMAENKKGSQF